MTPHTLAQKILLAHSDKEHALPGDILNVRCDLVMANDVSGPVAFRVLEKMGVDKVFDPTRVVMVSDHFVPAKDSRSAALQTLMLEWSTKQGVTYYGQGRGGIEHTVLVEDGWVVPGMVLAGGDSHTCTHGALGAFGTGLGSTDIARCLGFGSFWQPVPTTIRVVISGEKRPFVTGKDVILAVIQRIGVGGGTNAVLEFGGPSVTRFSVDERLAIANMAVEAGAETGLFPADEITDAWLAGRTDKTWSFERSDPDAEFAAVVDIDLDALDPLIAAPHSPGNVFRVADVKRAKVDQVYIGNCGNGTLTDLRQVAEVWRGRTIHPSTRAIIVPASQRIYLEAVREGLVEVFVQAGAMVSTPTCGACFGGHSGVLADGETAVTTTNRNFRGRMGPSDADIYLANAYVAAAAAVAGELIHPAQLGQVSSVA